MSEVTNYGGDIISGTGVIYLPQGDSDIDATAGGSAQVLTANTVYSEYILLSSFFVATSLVYNIGSAIGSIVHAGFGLYTASGDKLLLSVIDTVPANTSGARTVTLSPAWVIPPGIYTYSSVLDNSAAFWTQVGGRTAAVTTHGNSLASPNKWFGSQAAGSAGSGVLPTSLGTRAAATLEPCSIVLIA